MFTCHLDFKFILNLTMIHSIYKVSLFRSLFLIITHLGDLSCRNNNKLQLNNQKVNKYKQRVTGKKLG